MPCRFQLFVCASLALACGAFAESLPRVRVRLVPERANWETASLLSQGLGPIVNRPEPCVFIFGVTSEESPSAVLRSLRRRPSVADVKSVEPVLDPAPLLLGSLSRLSVAVEEFEELWQWHCAAEGLDPRNEAPGLDYLESYLERQKARAYPSDQVDFTGYFDLIDERLKHGSLRTQSGLQWTYVGPRNLDIPYRTYYGQRPIIGRVGALAYDPVTAGTYFLGGAKGGVWKTTDYGTQWTALSDSWPTLGVSCLCIVPQGGGVILAGTGDHHGGDAVGYGVMRSTDGGATWTATGQSVMGHSCVSEIRFDPDNPSLVLAVTGRGSGTGRVYRSLDAGQTWSVSLNVSADWSGLDVSVASGGIRTFWAVADAGSDVVYKSTDNGSTWTQVTVSGLGNSTVDVACSRIVPGTVYLLDSSSQKIWKSTDSGATWTNTTNNFSNQWGQSWYDFHIETSRLNSADVVYVGLIDIAVSLNGGSTWRNMGGANWTATYSGTAITHNDQHCLAVNPANPNEVLVGNDGGVYRATYNAGNDSVTWAILNKLLGITQFYTLAMHPTSADYAMGGTQDNATPNSFGDVNNWGNPGAGDGAGCLINPNNPANQYHSWYYQSIVRTDNSFGSSTTITPDWNGHSLPFIGKLWFDPNNPNLVYANTDYLNRYNRSTSTWTLKLGNQSFGAVIQSFAAAKSDSNRLYVGRTGQVWMSSDNGATWTRIDRQGLTNGLPNRSITDISVDPTNKNDVLVVTGGTGAGKVWRCSDTSAATPQWTPLSSGLPDIHHLCLARDPARPQTYWYVGNDAGVWRTTDGGGTWTDYSGPQGLPDVEIDALVPVSGTGYLNAATYGRGLWRVPLRENQSIAPSNLTVALGRVTSGSVTSLAGNDGDSLIVCKFVVPSQTSPIVRIDVVGTTSIKSPLSLALTCQSKMVASGLFSQTLALFDYTVSDFTVSRTDSIGTSPSTLTLAGTGTLANFVQQSDGQLRTRIDIRQTGPSVSVTPCVSFEQVTWAVGG